MGMSIFLLLAGSLLASVREDRKTGQMEKEKRGRGGSQQATKENWGGNMRIKLMGEEPHDLR